MTDPVKRICYVDCGKVPPECECRHEALMAEEWERRRFEEERQAQEDAAMEEHFRNHPHG